jgi:hypothetical protein
MLAKWFFLVGVAGLGAYVYNTASNYDPAVAPYSTAQVQEMLASAEVSMPRRDGDGTIRIWGVSKSAGGVNMAMKYAQEDWAPVINCTAAITELGPNESRVVADCGGTDNGSAIAATEMGLRTPMFDEFIQSTLHQREFDRSRATSEEMAIVMGNMGGMQREALQRADEMQRMQAEIEQANR